MALGLTQADVAAAMGVGQDYISRIESGRSKALQVELRHQLAAALELSPEDLGVCTPAAKDRLATLGAAEARAFIKVASIARETGHPAEGAAAAHQVARRLPRRNLTRQLACARADALLVEAVALGDLHDARSRHPSLALLDEAYRLMHTAEDAALLHAIILKIGNESRKAGDPRGARKWLDRAVNAAPTVGGAQAARIALLRVLGELRDPGQGGEHVRLLRSIEDTPDVWSATLHPLAAAEAEARYLLSFGRAVRTDIRRRLEMPSPVAVAPQWNVIARLTLAEILTAAGEDERALDELTAVLQTTTDLRALPRLKARGRELLDRNRAAEPALRELYAEGAQAA
jgi:DNA-binding XRE family transcriptional regulator